MRLVYRLLVLGVVLAAVGVGVGRFYAPAGPMLQAGFERAGLGEAGRRLLGTALASTPPAAASAALAQGDRPGAPTTHDETPPPLAPAITVLQARNAEFRDRLFVSGSLVARDEALVGPQIDGLRITEVLAEDGDSVQQGQVLARLDRSQLDALAAESDAALQRADAAVAEAKDQITQFAATSAQAEADLARGRKMTAGVLSQATLDQRTATAHSATAQLAGARSALAVAEADKQSQVAQRRELEVRMARTEVRAPVAGLISHRAARLGALAMSSADPLFRIIAHGAIDLDAEAPDDVLARVKTGMRAKVNLQGVDDPVVGAVRLISAEVDKTTRLGRVRIALPDGAPARVGSFATALVDIARRNGVSVPATAVTSHDGQQVVQVVEGDRIVVRPVEIGLVDRDSVEVLHGLAAGETVVARAAAFLRAGDVIRPVRLAEEAQR